MIKSVVRQYHWPPQVIEELYHDNIDYRGLEYWYHDVEAIVKEIKNK